MKMFVRDFIVLNLSATRSPVLRNENDKGISSKSKDAVKSAGLRIKLKLTGV